MPVLPYLIAFLAVATFLSHVVTKAYQIERLEEGDSQREELKSRAAHLIHQDRELHFDPRVFKKRWRRVLSRHTRQRFA